MQLDHLLSRVQPVSHTRRGCATAFPAGRRPGRLASRASLYDGQVKELLRGAEALARARAGAVAVDRPDLAVVRLTGADVLRYLHTVSSQHTADLRAGEAAEALLLSPKGKIELAFRLAVLADGRAELGGPADPSQAGVPGRQDVLADTEAAAAEPLAERLRRFVFRYDVAVSPPGPGAVSVVGAAVDDALEAAGLPVPPLHAGRAAVTSLSLVVHRTAVGADVVGAAAPAALRALEDAGVPRAPLDLWELLRVEHGVPRWGHELTDDVIAEEAGLLGSHVHLDKGCYPGQETVARVHNLGQVQRRLAGLVFQGEELPPPRAELVTDDGRRAGQVRTGVLHPELGPVALAYVRRIVPPGQLVLAGPLVAQVVDLPFRRAEPAA